MEFVVCMFFLLVIKMLEALVSLVGGLFTLIRYVGYRFAEWATKQNKRRKYKSVTTREIVFSIIMAFLLCGALIAFGEINGYKMR